jgi:hypothetical protein
MDAHGGDPRGGRRPDALSRTPSDAHAPPDDAPAAAPVMRAEMQSAFRRPRISTAT